MPLIDHKAREAIRTALDKSLVVEAAAGTGKTTELVERMVAVLSAGRTTIDRIAGVTDTEKTAGELKLRVRSELEKARRAEKKKESRRNLERALAYLEEARLSTIHSFCGDMLRERPVEAKIDPKFEVMTETQSRELYREAFHSWFQRKLEDLPEGTRRILRRRTRSGPTEYLIAAGWELVNWRDFAAPWQRPQFDRVAVIDSIVEKIHLLAKLTADPSDEKNNLFLDTAPARALSEDIRTLERAGPRDYDGLEAIFGSIASDRKLFERFLSPRKGKAQYNEQVKRDDILALHGELIAAINSFAEDAGSDLAPLLQAELGETVVEYQRLKERTGRLDFLDLLIRARDLLIQSRSVREHFQERFTHLFVDEFQDTDPLQAEILVLLSADTPEATDWRAVQPYPGKLFIVGDPKQAIYRFRRADVGTYEEVKQLLLRNGAELLQLTTSFRSLPSIQSLVNQAFAPYMDGDQEKLQAVRTALTAIEWPDDELSVFATLKGSLFAIRDDVLLEYRHRVGHFHPFRLPSDPLSDELQEVVESLRILAKLHRDRNYRPVAETLDWLLRETRTHLAFALRPSGEQVLANVLHIAELARKYEASGGLSFRGFVQELRSGADAAETAEAPIFEEGSEGIRMMSVHKAKGLEFPVVILADITAKICRQYPSRRIDGRSGLCAIPLTGCEPIDLRQHAELELERDRAEGVRLAYVAATRARDLLVVPTIGDDPRQSWDSVENWWVRPLYDAVYPESGKRQKPEEPPAYPQFGNDTVLVRPPDLTVDEKDTVWPGLHRFQKSGTRDKGYGVVWWDPRALTLNVPQSFGIRQEELLKESDDPQVLKKDLENYRNWQTLWDSVRQRAAEPEVIFRTATAQARNESDIAVPYPDVQVVELPRDFERPAGARFGALVHATLAAVPLDASADQVQQIAALYARVLGADERETSAAAAAIQSALAHPLMVRARDALAQGQCRRETPITLTLGDGTLVEGVLDLAFLEKDAWTVVDFKTDREFEKDLEHYKRQVGLYALAIGRATGQPSGGTLMRV